MNVLAVFIGGGLGSILRFGISKLSMSLYNGHFPMGTFVSNMLSCFLLALLSYSSVKMGENVTLRLLIITGFCGGFSTFSTFSLETLELLKNGNYVWATTNILVSILTALGILFFVLKDNFQ